MMALASGKSSIRMQRLTNRAKATMLAVETFTEVFLLSVLHLDRNYNGQSALKRNTRNWLEARENAYYYVIDLNLISRESGTSVLDQTQNLVSQSLYTPVVRWTQRLRSHLVLEHGPE